MQKRCAALSAQKTASPQSRGMQKRSSVTNDLLRREPRARKSLYTQRPLNVPFFVVFAHATKLNTLSTLARTKAYLWYT